MKADDKKIEVDCLARIKTKISFSPQAQTDAGRSVSSSLRHGRVAARRLSGEAVSLTVKERVAAAGIDPTGFSGHSLRAGFATSAVQAEVPTLKIRGQTGHASDNPARGRDMGGFLDGAGDGLQYLFWVDGEASQGPKRDPYARELTLTPAFPASYCILRDPAAYPWHDGAWRPPDFSKLIIYQLHIGTWWAVDAVVPDLQVRLGRASPIRVGMSRTCGS